MIADRLRSSCGKECSVARIKGALFGVLSYFERPGELENRVADIQRQFHDAAQMQQAEALRIACSITLCTEADSLEELYQAGKKKLKK